MPTRLAFDLVRRILAPLLLAAMACASWAQTLHVAADGSLAAAMQAVAREFEAGRPGVKVTLRLGASGTLLEQIARGTATDVLASADAETAVLGVQRRLLVADLRSSFAANRLVLVVPASLNLPVQRLADLARPEVVRVAVGRPANEPVGRYAREAINAQRLWPAVQRKAVLVDDGREVLALVAAADVEAGFVYATDVAAAAGAADRVRVVETLPTTTPIRYPAHVVAASKQPELARDFITYLRSGPARAVFQRFGFGLP
ncbi:MAG: molybdate ABC transporter substrate-binding protein [Rubrivivax sp.]|nr:molybdate ABC transporter substrate-binding protein [Rubrivivax sp.]